ncbi:hypothetical protein PtB15_17B73 [Puccinia triticina]|nr:hypothetical protein PtB15_17B73 [Puccinia triticina]
MPSTQAALNSKHKPDAGSRPRPLVECKAIHDSLTPGPVRQTTGARSARFPLRSFRKHAATVSERCQGYLRLRALEQHSQRLQRPRRPLDHEGSPSAAQPTGAPDHPDVATETAADVPGLPGAQNDPSEAVWRGCATAGRSARRRADATHRQRGGSPPPPPSGGQLSHPGPAAKKVARAGSERTRGGAVRKCGSACRHAAPQPSLAHITTSPPTLAQPPLSKKKQKQVSINICTAKAPMRRPTRG